MIRFFCLSAFLLSATASAADYHFEITPYAGYSLGGTFTDTETDVGADLDDAANIGLIFNARNNANTQWEVLFSQQDTSAAVVGAAIPDAKLDLSVRYLQFGGTYEGDGEAVRPFLAATIGATQFDVSEPGYGSDTFFSFSIGPGLQIQPSKRLGLRLEARAFGTLVRSGTGLFCVSNPGGGSAGCALTVAGDVLWQVQASAGIVFRF